MKLLLDTMMPDEIGKLLIGHEVIHAVDLGWRHLSNGKLLSAAESEGFEVLLTKDSNMPYQQNLTGRSICLVILRPRSQHPDDLFALAPHILRLLPTLKPGSVTRVTADCESNTMTHELALIPPAAESPTQVEETHLEVLQQPAGQLPQLITSMGASAVEAFITFFAASIRNAHTAALTFGR